MSARRRSKRLRQAAYSAGPLAPWRRVSYLVGIARARKNRRIAAGLPEPVHEMEMGSIEGFRIISSPVVADQFGVRGYISAPIPEGKVRLNAHWLEAALRND